MALLAAAGCSDAPQDLTQHAWLQLGPDSERIARVATEDANCPTIEVDGRAMTMQVRAAPDPPSFPVLTCEASIPAEATRVAIGDAVLPLPHPEARRLAIIGDTGCRVEEGHAVQACDDPSAWPFAALANIVSDLLAWLTGDEDHGDLDDLARSVAALDPDLIVHVGDYLYREGPCPDGNPGCQGSPYGYNWETIEADYFNPAEPMFRTAPLVLTRGNHESCSRAGPVWFRFFDPRPYDPKSACDDHTAPYAIEVGDLQLLMLDSSSAADATVDPAQAAILRQQFDELRRIAGPRALLVTHRPMWVFSHVGEQDGQEVLGRGNATLQVASNDALPPGVQAVLSGHVHMFQLLGFAGTTRVPQIVVGNSGTALDSTVTTPLAGLEIAGATVGFGEMLDEFGFATLETNGASWRLTARDLGGAVLRACTIAGTEASCP